MSSIGSEEGASIQNQPCHGEDKEERNGLTDAEQSGSLKLALGLCWDARVQSRSGGVHASRSLWAPCDFHGDQGRGLPPAQHSERIASYAAGSMEGSLHASC